MLKLFIYVTSAKEKGELGEKQLLWIERGKIKKMGYYILVRDAKGGNF